MMDRLWLAPRFIFTTLEELLLIKSRPMIRATMDSLVCHLGGTVYKLNTSSALPLSPQSLPLRRLLHPWRPQCHCCHQRSHHGILRMVQVDCLLFLLDLRLCLPSSQQTNQQAHLLSALLCGAVIFTPVLMMAPHWLGLPCTCTTPGTI